MTTKYYLPLGSNSLGHYFSRALIVPAKYFINKPEDIQNRISNWILLSTQKWLEGCDCSIELTLTASEIKSLKPISKNCYLYDQAIPISRVNTIYFSGKSQKETTLWNINNGAAFIPEKMVVVDDVRNSEAIPEQALKTVDSVNTQPDLTDKIRRYDIILGGLSFMKVGRDVNLNFPFNYFPTLSFFNKLIEEQTIKAFNDFKWNFNNKYIGLFSKSDSEWSKYREYIFKNVELSDVEVLGAKDNIKIEKKYGLIKLESINQSSILFDLAVLATYGENKNKSTDNLVSDINNGIISTNKAEEVALLFGLNNGYSKLRNQYKEARNEYPVKFKLDSKLDYYTIESIYQFVFCDLKKSYAFEYIDEMFENTLIKSAPTGFDTFKILDTVVIAKKKKTALEVYFETLSQDFYEKLVNVFSQWNPPFTSTDVESAKLYFQKVLNSSLENAVLSFQKDIEAEFEQKSNKLKTDLELKHKIEIENLRDEFTKKIELSVATNTATEIKPLIPEQPKADEVSAVKEPIIEYDIQTEPRNVENKDLIESTIEYDSNSDEQEIEANKFDNMTVKELQQIAKKRGVSYSGMSKKDLIKSLKFLLLSKKIL